MGQGSEVGPDVEGEKGMRYRGVYPAVRLTLRGGRGGLFGCLFFSDLL